MHINRILAAVDLLVGIYEVSTRQGVRGKTNAKLCFCFCKYRENCGKMFLRKLFVFFYDKLNFNCEEGEGETQEFILDI